MPKAEAGSNKYLSNKLKAKGLTRLRWYCQVCEKPCRDAHAFKMHTSSESHVRQMLVVGEDPKKYVDEYSKEFLHDFIQLLKTGHGEKQVNMNHFYQEYIANRDHIHMNSTKWPSLTEFAKYLGREGICRVEETEKGLHIAWIDDSPEALRRRDALRRKEAQDQGNEEVEQRIIREQIKRAQANAQKQNGGQEEDRGLQRQEGERVKLSFGGGAKPPATRSESPAATPAATEEGDKGGDAALPKDSGKPAFGAMSLKMGAKPLTKNVFAQAKKSKNALGGASSGSKKTSTIEQPKKMSEAERIMKQEMEKKRSRESAGFGIPGGKKQRS
ncbi:DNA/RNA-binding protein KIN17 [Geosmithia morbida]|uniref:DNA/RNA-binding protein KIN17 n=1 Tax=Geosmithia morbida TaxID=1094350 RepID=A0A9P5CYB0_9HYPO|nr:DNA/RNA-binding protein KIN17 [Geosmithia morbida]KAF4120198.1 DNA/RNA-binding protein KIN17 [Geosmithia morbida]